MFEEKYFSNIWFVWPSQVLRALHIRPSSQMLADILSRLVETVSEQGEDMQVGVYYVKIIDRKICGGQYFAQCKN